jgi:hypothetical protein
VHVPKGLKVRRLHKAFLRWHDANNWPILRDALRRMGRADLIGTGKHQLIPAWQPAGTGDAPEGRRMGGRKAASTTAAVASPAKPVGQNKPMRFRTQHTGLKGVSIPGRKK